MILSERKRLGKALKAQQPTLKLAMLFGSTHENWEGYESDIDIGLLDESPLSTEDIRRIGCALTVEFNRPIDIIDLIDVPYPITRSALQGDRLFGSDDCFASLYARHLINQEDFGRLYDRMIDQRIDGWTR